MGRLAFLAGVEGLAHGRCEVGLEGRSSTSPRPRLSSWRVGCGPAGDRVGTGPAEGGFVFPRIHPLPDPQGLGLSPRSRARRQHWRLGRAPEAAPRAGARAVIQMPRAHAVGGAQCCFGQQRAGKGAQVGGLFLGRGFGQRFDVQGAVRERGVGWTVLAGRTKAKSRARLARGTAAGPHDGPGWHVTDQRRVFGQGLVEGLRAVGRSGRARTTTGRPRARSGGCCVDGQAFRAVEQVKHSEFYALRWLGR